MGLHHWYDFMLSGSYRELDNVSGEMSSFLLCVVPLAKKISACQDVHFHKVDRHIPGKKLSRIVIVLARHSRTVLWIRVRSQCDNLETWIEG